jgi:hypothetical protein
MLHLLSAEFRLKPPGFIHWRKIELGSGVQKLR